MYRCFCPKLWKRQGCRDFAAGILTTLPVVCLGVLHHLPASCTAFWCGKSAVVCAHRFDDRHGDPWHRKFSIALYWRHTCWCGNCHRQCASSGRRQARFSENRRDYDRPLYNGAVWWCCCGGWFTIPIEHMLGGSWNLALAFWALPAALVLALWLPQALRAKHNVAHSGFKVIGLWKDRLAWQVTFFMGLQSSMAYIVFGWLAPILREQGLSGTAAGRLVSFSIMVQVVTCLAIPRLRFGRKARACSMWCFA